MKVLIVVGIGAAVALVRLAFRRRRRSRAPGGTAKPDAAASSTGHRRRTLAPGGVLAGALGDVGLVAAREIRERVRGRIFRVGTLVILVAIAAAIVIPALHHGSTTTRQTVAVVGGVPLQTKQVIDAAAARNGDTAVIVEEVDIPAARAALRSGRVDLAVVDDAEVLVDRPTGDSRSTADAGLVQDVAISLGVLQAYRAADLTPAQAARISRARAVPVHSLQPGGRGATQASSVVGLVLLFFMLSQYNTWILIGVMQEKSSRVVEVLLATVRPIQLLGGKVLGIGLVALGQATLIVGFALAVGAAVGSDLLHGAAPLVLACELLWLVLGYAFYCWVYAAAGSTAERQDQVQTLAIPLSLPILLGYVFSITVVSTGNPDVFFKILAYLPPTAPFCMPVLVSLHLVQWWQFLVSVTVTLAGIVAMAAFAARIYRRAVLRTGGRVRLRELVVRTPTGAP